MMEHEVKPSPGARRERRRVGRGDASGHGSYSGRGVKGQRARTGRGHIRPGFEGGQLPLVKKLPARRGFTNLFRTEYRTVNLRNLESLPAGTEVTPDALVSAGLLHAGSEPVKVLGDGELTKPLTISAHRFTASARQKIEAAGGTVKELQ